MRSGCKSVCPMRMPRKRRARAGSQSFKTAVPRSNISACLANCAWAVSTPVSSRPNCDAAQWCAIQRDIPLGAKKPARNARVFFGLCLENKKALNPCASKSGRDRSDRRSPILSLHPHPAPFWSGMFCLCPVPKFCHRNSCRHLWPSCPK
jgi:hypothetical protein